ncbi:MAG TPA: zf-HC2 domain-containing protein [Gemmataceae bacterium]|nr:zf-HC2 domain-containing protein [Gemmataceae bacterium]
MWPFKREDRAEPQAPPAQGWLTAYVDGELTDEERARVEAWLARNPEARAEVEGQRRLKGLWDRCPVPEPDRFAWDDVLARVESGLGSAATEKSARPAHRQGPRDQTWLWAAGAVAAAVLLGLWLSRRDPPAVDPPGTEEVFEVASEADVVIDDMDPADAPAVVVGRVPAQESFPLKPGELLEVASPDEVTILSMDAADLGALVVGEAPVAGALALATREEVQVDQLTPHPGDETMPYLHAPKGGWPMVVAPVKAARKDGPP